MNVCLLLLCDDMWNCLHFQSASKTSDVSKSKQLIRGLFRELFVCQTPLASVADLSDSCIFDKASYVLFPHCCTLPVVSIGLFIHRITLCIEPSPHHSTLAKCHV